MSIEDMGDMIEHMEDIYEKNKRKGLSRSVIVSKHRHHQKQATAIPVEMGLKPDTWGTMSVQSKMAACMYPDKVPTNIQQEMLNVGGKDRAALQDRINRGNSGDGRKSAEPVQRENPLTIEMMRRAGLVQKPVVETKTTKSWWQK